MFFELKPKQQERVDAISTEPTQAALIADITGYGKTAVAVDSMRAVEAETALVIAPLNTFDGWTKTVKSRWPGMPVKEILAADQSNKVFKELRAGKRGVYLIGREFMHLAVKYKRWRWTPVNKSIDAIVFDEIHAASNRKTATYKTLTTMKPNRLKLALSATPGGDKFEGLWAVTRWLWPDTVNPETEELYVDRSFWRWAARWADIGFDPYTTTGKKLVGERVPGAFVESLPLYFRMEDEAEAGKVGTHTYRVQAGMTAKQKEQYAQMLQKAVTWLDENPLVADLPIVQKIRLRQMLLGEVAFNEDGEVDFAEDMASYKADLVEKIIDREGTDTPILLLTDSRRYALRLTERLRKQGYAAEPWTGSQSKAERFETKERFLSGETKYIVATISKAFAEGTDGLQHVCSTEIWLNKAFSSVMNEQVAGRLNRRGQEAERITRYELYVPGTADEEDWVRDAQKTIRRQAELAREG